LNRYLSSVVLPGLLLAVALPLASCGGSGSTQQGESEPGGHHMKGMDDGRMPGMNHGSEGMRGMSMEPVDPQTVGVRVELTSEPAAPLPGQPVTLRYRVTDPQSGEPLTDLPIDHEQPMHLIAVSKDLEQFQHVHPEVGTDDETYGVTTEFPEAGTYVLYDEFVRNGQSVLDRRELPVGEASDAKASLAPDLASKVVDGGVSVALLAPQAIRAGEEASFTFILDQGERSVNDLEPYLGAAAHVAVVSEDTEDFAHVHGKAEQGRGEGHEGMGSMDSPPDTFGPEVGFHYTFPGAGLYKLWGQFSRGGRVITVPFVVEVQ
jgi:Cu+-exporting ATPase